MLIKKSQTHHFTASCHRFTPSTRLFSASFHLFGASTRFSGPFAPEEVAARTYLGACCHFAGASSHLFGASTRLAGAYAPEVVATRGKKVARRTRTVARRGKKVRLAHFDPGKGHLEPRAAEWSMRPACSEGAPQLTDTQTPAPRSSPTGWERALMVEHPHRCRAPESEKVGNMPSGFHIHPGQAGSIPHSVARSSMRRVKVGRTCSPSGGGTAVHRLPNTPGLVQSRQGSRYESLSYKVEALARS